MIIKDNVKILGDIASKMYLTTDESGMITGQLTSGGGGGEGGGATLVYNGKAIGKGQENYIEDNYYLKYGGSITAGQTATNGTLPGNWSSPFVFNDPDVINTLDNYFVENMEVKVMTGSFSHYGTIVRGGGDEFKNSENKTIYNFTDRSATPYTLTEGTFFIAFIFYYIQPHPTDSFDRYNFNNNTNTGIYTTDNAIIIKRGNGGVDREYFNIKLTIEITDTDIPGKFKLLLMNGEEEALQIFSYPSIYDDNGKSFNITVDAFTESTPTSTGDYSTSILVTNFPITKANISIISYIQ